MWLALGEGLHTCVEPVWLHGDEDWVLVGSLSYTVQGELQAPMPFEKGWAISKHSIILANESIAIGRIEHFDWTRSN